MKCSKSGHWIFSISRKLIVAAYFLGLGLSLSTKSAQAEQKVQDEKSKTILEIINCHSSLRRVSTGANFSILESEGFLQFAKGGLNVLLKRDGAGFAQFVSIDEMERHFILRLGYSVFVFKFQGPQHGAQATYITLGRDEVIGINTHPRPLNFWDYPIVKIEDRSEKVIESAMAEIMSRVETIKENYKNYMNRNALNSDLFFKSKKTFHQDLLKVFDACRPLDDVGRAIWRIGEELFIEF